MTDNEFDDLVEEWHNAEPGDAAAQYQFESWMRMHTNWTYSQFENWVRTGDPENGTDNGARLG